MLRVTTYVRLVGLLLATIVAGLLAPDTTTGRSLTFVLVTASVGSAVRLAGLWEAGRVGVRVALALAIGASVLSALDRFPHQGGEGIAFLVMAGALLVVIALLVPTLNDHEVIEPQTVLAAISIYFLLGLTFAFLYRGAALIGDAPFFTSGTDGTLSDHVYFSFVTMTTVGFGDLAPATHTGRAIAVLEAMAGQLYLVTVLALVVSNLGQVRRPPAP